MKTVDDKKLAAGIWALIGIITAPNILFVMSWARFQTAYPDLDRHSVAYVFSYIVFGYLCLFSFRYIRTFGERDFGWAANHPKIFPRFAMVFGLEVAAYYLISLSDWLSGILNNLGLYAFYTTNTWEFAPEEAVYICLLLLTLPLATRLIRAYLDFVQSWIAASLAFWGYRAHIEEAEIPPEQSTNDHYTLEQQIESNIQRASLKGYLAMVAMVVTLVATIISFQYVFQSSATTRATQLIKEIEATPVALSASFSDHVRNLRRISTRLLKAASEDPNRVRVVSEVEASLGQITFTTLRGEESGINDYLRQAMNDLQSFEETQDEMSAELTEFLFRLTELHRELSDTARMNWDIILLRTAIVLLGLVSVKIFHSVMMSENQQRNQWETRLVALKAVKSGALSDPDIKNYLAISVDAPADQEAVAPDLPSIDVDQLAQKIAEAFAKKL